MDVTQTFAATFVDELASQRAAGPAAAGFCCRGGPGGTPGPPGIGRRFAAGGATGAAPGPAHPTLPFREPLVPPPGQVPSAQGDAGQTITSGRTQPTPAQLATPASALQRARRPLGGAGGERDRQRPGHAPPPPGLAGVGRPRSPPP